MTEIDCTPETIRRLVELVAEHGLTELTVEAEGTTVTVRAQTESAAVPALPVAVALPAAPQASPVVAPAVAAPAAPRSGRPASAIALESPMVGVFYHSAAPEDPPFVVVGDIIRVGQAIGLIEAMKVFSEVPAEAGGRVVEIAVENGKLVQQGQPLLYVELA